MYRVLIAEDEVWIRDALAEMIERFELEFKVAAVASDGVEAWNILNDAWPDVIITDIVMPHVDGLNLLKKCDEFKIPIVPIVISGYENFNYAQQAMRYGATEYLLKPVVAEELQAALLRSAERLEQLRYSNDILRKIQQFIDLMETADHTILTEEVAAIVQQIMKTRQMNEAMKRGVLQILSNKIFDQMENVIEDYAYSALPVQLESRALHNYFYTQLELWSRSHYRDEQRHTMLLRKVEEYVEKNYYKEITLSEIASFTDLSVSRFCVLFKTASGHSFINYLNSYRIEQAKRLLLNHDLKVYEIADMIGFSSMPFFNRLFKRLTNQTPNEYRRSLGI